MPSPVAHGLAGLAVARLALHRRRALPGVKPLPDVGNSHLERISWIVAFVFAANAADLDFLAGFLVGEPNRFHHGPTHSLIAAVVFGLLAGALTGLVRYEPWRRFGFLMGLSYSTHLVLDCITLGTKEPYGMKILWPFSSKPLMSPFHLFLDIRRSGGTSTFLPSLVQWHNAEAIVRELMVMAGVWVVYRAISAHWFNLTPSERKTQQ